MSTSAGKNGTCYAQDECEKKGGAGFGSCAGGYGVCCVCKNYALFLQFFILGCFGVQKDMAKYSDMPS